MLKRKKSTTAAKKATKYRKRFKKESLSSQSNNRLHFVKRHVDYFTVPVSNLTGAAGAFVWTLNNVPAYTELTAMYDQYKICGVYVKFMPKQTSATSCLLADAAKANARFLTCIDLNDDSPPLTADEIRQYETCQVTSIVDTHEVYIKKPLFVNSSGQNVSDWLSTANPSTRWYGLKYFCEPSGITGVSQFLFTVECVFYLCFKNIK